jgi:trk system potassium uptake protein
MRVIVMGGGKVGRFMARELQEGGHSVIVIERDRRHAEQIAEETGALAIEGDGTDLELLGDIEIRATDLFVAVTGVDEDNLVACQLVRTVFGVRKVLGRLNDPRNRPTFDAIGIPVVSVTDLLAQVIEHELEFSELMRVAILGRGDVSLFQIELPSSAAKRAVSSINLPEEAVLVAVQRGDTVHVPTPTFELRPGDRVLAVGNVHLEEAVRDALFAADRVDDGPGFELEGRAI